MKKTTKKKNLLVGMASFIFVFIFLFVYHLITEENKLQLFRQDILYDYYDKEKLNKVLKEHLDDAYVNDLPKDFDNFVISLVLNEFADLESEKFKVYNSFLDKDWMDEYNENGKKQADQIEGKPINKDIYYLKLTTFHEGSTYEHVKSLSEDFKKYDDLIIDLRDNTGGSFKELKKVLSLFIEDDSFLFQLNTRDEQEKYYSNNKEPITFNKIVLLTNHKTASSSELLILSLKGNLDNVTQIGTPTYGKHIGISMRTFRDGSGMVFISSIMEGPNSQFVDTNGISPDIEVGHTKEVYNSLEHNKQADKMRNEDYNQQLKAAIEYLEKK